MYASFSLAVHSAACIFVPWHRACDSASLRVRSPPRPARRPAAASAACAVHLVHCSLCIFLNCLLSFVDLARSIKSIWHASHFLPWPHSRFLSCLCSSPGGAFFQFICTVACFAHSSYVLIRWVANAHCGHADSSMRLFAWFLPQSSSQKICIALQMPNVAKIGPVNLPKANCQSALYTQSNIPCICVPGTSCELLKAFPRVALAALQRITARPVGRY